MVSTHLKNIGQNGNLPQVGVKIKRCLKPPPNHYDVDSVYTHLFEKHNNIEFRIISYQILWYCMNLNINKMISLILYYFKLCPTMVYVDLEDSYVLYYKHLSQNADSYVWGLSNIRRGPSSGHPLLYQHSMPDNSTVVLCQFLRLWNPFGQRQSLGFA